MLLDLFNRANFLVRVHGKKRLQTCARGDLKSHDYWFMCTDALKLIDSRVTAVSFANARRLVRVKRAFKQWLKRGTAAKFAVDARLTKSRGCAWCVRTLAQVVFIAESVRACTLDWPEHESVESMSASALSVQHDDPLFTSAIVGRTAVEEPRQHTEGLALQTRVRELEHACAQLRCKEQEMSQTIAHLKHTLGQVRKVNIAMRRENAQLKLHVRAKRQQRRRPMHNVDLLLEGDSKPK